MQNVLLIWHADKATCCMQSFANPHKHCCGEQLAARVAPTLAYNHVCWHLWTNCGVESCCAPCLLAPSRLRMCTRRHVLRAAVRRIGLRAKDIRMCTRLCPLDIRMCTRKHVLRAAVRRIRLCPQDIRMCTRLCPQDIRMCTRRHVLRAAVRRIRLCLQDIRMCTHRHVLRAAVRRIRLCHQCTCVSVDMYYSAILCAVFTCAPKTYVFVSTGM